MMFENLLWCLGIYLLYRFVFELVIPIAKTVSRMKTTVSKMQEQQQPFTKTPPTQKPTEAPKSTTTTNGEYIDFEEIKD